MAKYVFRYRIITTHDIEVEADSLQEAKDKYNTISNDEIIQDFTDKQPQDLSYADVEEYCIFDENGDYAYTTF